MKYLMLLLFPISSFACPDLTGKFLCQNSAGEKVTFVITQSLNNGIHTYNYVYDRPDIEPVTAVADGSFKDVDEPEFKGSFKYTCENEVLVYEKIGIYYEGGQPHSKSKLVISDSINADGDYYSKLTYSSAYYEQKDPLDLEIEEICKRQP